MNKHQILGLWIFLLYIYMLLCAFSSNLFLHLIKCATLSLKVISGGIELLTFPRGQIIIVQPLTMCPNFLHFFHFFQRPK